jgi:hypothetical protein
MSTPWTQLPPAVLGQLGTDLALLAQKLREERGLSDMGRSLVVELESLGIELQTLVHALGHSPHTPPEEVPLLDAMQATRRQWLPELARRGLRVQVEGQAINSNAEPARLQHALDLLLAHGLAAGVDLRLLVGPDSGHAPSVSMSGSGTGPDSSEVHGQLLQWLLRTQTWRLERPECPAGTWCMRLVLGIPAPTGADAEDSIPKRHWTQQDRVLIVDSDDRTRAIAGSLLRGAGLRGDCVASLPQAEAALRDGAPSTVVCGFTLDEPGVLALRAAIEKERPGVRWVELVDAPYVFAAGSADGLIPARISRNDLSHTLLASLAD